MVVAVLVVLALDRPGANHSPLLHEAVGSRLGKMEEFPSLRHLIEADVFSLKYTTFCDVLQGGLNILLQVYLHCSITIIHAEVNYNNIHTSYKYIRTSIYTLQYYK